MIMKIIAAVVILSFFVGCTGEMCVGMKHFNAAKDERSLKEGK